MTVWDSEERLKVLSDILDELMGLEDDQVILVEGKRDRSGLNLLGVKGEMILVQTRDGIFHIAEQLANEKKRAVILTDWDRKGGHLCRLLREALIANNVPFDDTMRGRLAKVSRGNIKDVESLPSFFSRLVAEVRITDGEGFGAR